MPTPNGTPSPASRRAPVPTPAPSPSQAQNQNEDAYRDWGYGTRTESSNTQNASNRDASNAQGNARNSRNGNKATNHEQDPNVIGDPHTGYTFPFEGTFDEAVQRSREQRERRNREIEEKMHARTNRSQDDVQRRRDREFDEYVRRLHSHDRDIKSKYLEFQREARQLMDDPALSPVMRKALSSTISQVHAKFRKYDKAGDKVDINDAEALNEALTNVLNDDMKQYRKIADVKRDNYDDYIDQIDVANKFYGVNDIPRMSLEEYVQWCASTDDARWDQFNPVAMQNLMDSLRDGKKVTYTQMCNDEKEWKERRTVRKEQDNQQPSTDEMKAHQQFDDAKSAAEFVKSESDYIDSDETKAHDINISQTADGKFNVESTVPNSVLTDSNEKDWAKSEKPMTVADILRMHYHGENVVISIGNEKYPVTAFDNMDVFVTGDNQVVPVINNQDAFNNASVDVLDPEDTDNDITPFAASPSSTTRSAAPSAATRSNAEKIKSSMHSSSNEETVWVCEHIRNGHFVTHYSRSRPHHS